MKKLENLIVTQIGNRHCKQLKEMANYVKNGGRWTKDYMTEFAKKHNLPYTSSLIQISRFEDGQEFIHDGHHRSITTKLGGRDFLYPEEYEVKEWTYDSYIEINHENGWYTPFDPRIHVRKADFLEFKKMARNKFLTEPDKAAQWILNNVDLFRRERTVWTICDLIKEENFSSSFLKYLNSSA